jgi:chromosome segregation ATPase
MLKKNQLESEEMAKVKDDTESSQLQSSLTDARQELKQLKTLLKVITKLSDIRGKQSEVAAYFDNVFFFLLQKKDGEVSSLKAGLDQTLERMKQLELLQESQNRLEFIEMEKENLAKANDELQQQIFNLSTQVETSASAAASMKRTLATVEVEFANYKDKAKSILKQKDDLIALSHDSQGSSRDSSQTGLDNPFLPEVNALKYVVIVMTEFTSMKYSHRILLHFN